MPDVQYLDDVANTVRRRPWVRGPQGALVVGSTLTSHYWLNLLPLARDSRLRCFITEADLEGVFDRLHVYPEVVPCFLVFYDGFAVDWFPAPLPEPGCARDPKLLLAEVSARLDAYGAP